MTERITERTAELKCVSSESVSDGHPDKIADQISDSVLDFCLSLNPDAKVAIEVMVNSKAVVISGESDMAGHLSDDKLQEICNKVFALLSYPEGVTLPITNHINSQSREINSATKRGAGDQVTVVGYACNDNEFMYPEESRYSHMIMEMIVGLRSNDTGILADAKCQVNLFNDEANIGVSVQHTADTDITKLDLESRITHLLPITINKIDINPAGSFILGGPYADTGMTGRKIIVDSYGPQVPHGGGCFSGKDPTKLDRSAAYAARWIAKNIIKSKVATRCMVHLSYMIGRPEPTSVCISSDSGDDYALKEIIMKTVPLCPLGIIESLNLKRPIYAKNCNFSHFYNKDTPWETDMSLVSKINKQ